MKLSSASEPLSLPLRLIAAALIGALAAVIALSPITAAIHDASAGDLQWPLDGARVLLRGENPYGSDFRANTNQQERLDVPLWYPMPAVLVMIPFAPLPDRWAMAAFMSFSAALLAFLLGKRGWSALLVCGSSPFVWACLYGQWAPLIAVAALSSTAAPLSMTKPSLGLASLAYNPTKRGFILCTIIGLLTLVIWPTWIFDWQANLGQMTHRPPILYAYGGIILAAALLCWRRPEGRLLFVLSCMPQNFWFYDQVALGLVPTTLWTRVVWVICSWLAVVGYIALGGSVSAWDWTMWLMYLPALVILLVSWWQGRQARLFREQSPQAA